MVKDFNTFINEGLFDRNQSEFNIGKTDKGVEQIYIPKTKEDLYKYIELDIEQAKKEGTYPDVNLNNIDVSELRNGELDGLFGGVYYNQTDIYAQINPDISNWNIKYIPTDFFNSNKQIKEFTIPDGVASIGERAFQGCSSLTSITIPNSVTSIGDYAFWGCSSLASIEIPNSVTNIGESAFCICKGLTSVTIPDGVETIGNRTFDWCWSLTSVSIPNGVTSIENHAFDHCGGLTSVTISKHCNIDVNSFHKKCKIIRREDD